MIYRNGGGFLEKSKSQFIVRYVLLLAADGFTVAKNAIGPEIIHLLQEKHSVEGLNINSVGQTIRRLEQRGLLLRRKQGKSVVFSLSDKGQKRLNQLLLIKEVASEENIPWDGFWRIVLFSIPEKQKHIRGIFRQKLRSLGFVAMHRSAWVSPHCCEETLHELITNLQINEYASVIQTDAVSSETQLLQRFNLEPRLTVVENLLAAVDIPELVQPVSLIDLSNQIEPNSIQNDDDEIIPIAELD